MAFTHGGEPGGVSILSGDGAAGFTIPTSGEIAIGSAVPGSTPLAVVGDFNGDGKADLAVADQTGSTLTVLLGDGANGFTAAPGNPSFFSTDGVPSRLVTGDFNGDGILDLALAESGGVEVQIGKGDGTFSQPFLRKPVYRRNYADFHCGGGLQRRRAGSPHDRDRTAATM